MSDTETLSPEEQLIAKHKSEKKKLQAQILQLKKSVNKDKKRKKEVAQEIATLEQEMQLRHQSELEELNSSQMSNLEVAIEKNSLSDDTPTNDHNGAIGDLAYAPRRVTKAEKRRQKKSQVEREREELIRESKKNNKFSSRNIEIAKMKKILMEQNLTSHDIKSDGDCLFAAIVHQLSDGKTVADLRSLASNFIRQHQDDFLPFITDPTTGDMMTPDQLDNYCTQMETTSTWGGQPELRALSQGLKRKIVVIQAEGEPITFGEEFPDPAINLTYYRHLYELGEHYNSVREIPQTDS